MITFVRALFGPGCDIALAWQQMTTSVPNFVVRLGRLTAQTGLALAISACAGPLAPNSVLTGPSATSGSDLISNPITVTSSRVVATFPLTGVFTLTLSAADGTAGSINGNYTGQAVASLPGNTTTTLELSTVQSAGLGSNVTGLQASGSGAFIDEGDFSLSLSLTSPTLKSSDGSVVKVTLRGTSRISCNAAHHIVVTQHGTGSTPRIGDVIVDEQHEVANTNCS